MNENTFSGSYIEDLYGVEDEISSKTTRRTPFKDIVDGVYGIFRGAWNFLIYGLQGSLPHWVNKRIFGEGKEINPEVRFRYSMIWEGLNTLYDIGIVTGASVFLGRIPIIGPLLISKAAIGYSCLNLALEVPDLALRYSIYKNPEAPWVDKIDEFLGEEIDRQYPGMIFQSAVLNFLRPVIQPVLTGIGYVTRPIYKGIKRLFGINRSYSTEQEVSQEIIQQPIQGSLGSYSLYSI